MYNYYSIIIFKYFSRQYRFIAYRQLTGWCWGWLNWEKVRVVLPSSVTAIRKKFNNNIMLDLVIRPLEISHQKLF